MVNERGWLWVIFALYFVLAVGYSWLMPLWEAPDEAAHYHLAWRIVRIGEYASEERNYEAIQPRPYYYFASMFIRAMDKIDPAYSDYYFPKEFKYNIRIPEPRFDWNSENYRFLLGVYLLRWVNILFGGFALWLNWKAFLLIAPDKPYLRLSALALAALTPQYLHIMSSINNDVWGTVAGALLFYLTIRILNGASFGLSLLGIILALALPLSTKLTVLPVSAAVLIIIGTKWFFSLNQKRWLIIAAALTLIIGILIYIFFPESIQTASHEITWRLFGIRKKGISMEYLQTISNQIIQTYWGKVGWLAVGLPDGIFLLMTALGFVGAALQVRKFIKNSSTNPQFNLWAGTFLIALFTILAVARNALTTGATQGRLLFPAIGAISLLMISGWHDLLPQQFQRKLPVFVIILMLMFTIVLWMFGVLPIYFQPFLD